MMREGKQDEKGRSRVLAWLSRWTTSEMALNVAVKGDPSLLLSAISAAGFEVPAGLSRRHSWLDQVERSGP